MRSQSGYNLLKIINKKRHYEAYVIKSDCYFYLTYLTDRRDVTTTRNFNRAEQSRSNGL